MIAMSRQPYLNLFVGTANLGNAPVDAASLAAWVPIDGAVNSMADKARPQKSENEYDDDDYEYEEEDDESFELIVLGFQEATFEGSDAGTSFLHGMLEEHLSSYKHIVKHQRGEMRLEIFAHQSIANQTKVHHVAAQNTGQVGGLGNLPNKGGILAELLLFDNLRLSFTTCHLEAHEGKNKYNTRCATLCDIFQGTRPAGVIHDTTLTNHVAFVLGDLNFRTDIPPDENNTQNPSKMIKAFIANEQWDELNQYDELKRALRNKDCLAGFQTLDCKFHPTFKVARANGYKYNEKRRPSYTDRILWKTGHELASVVQALTYEGVGQFTTSDHKPVRGVFRVRLNEKIQFQPRMARSSLLRASIMGRSDPTSSIMGNRRHRLHVFISQIRCQLNRPDPNNLRPLLFSLTSSTESTEINDSNTMPFDRRVPSPYVMFMPSPEASMDRHVYYWSRIRSDLLCRHHVTTDELDGTKVRTAMGWPRTSVQKQTREPCWDSEQVKVSIHAHSRDGEPISLTGALLKITVMDAEGIRNGINPLIGSFSFNLANLLLTCLRTHDPLKSHRKKQSSSVRNLGASLRQSMRRSSATVIQPCQSHRKSIFNVLGLADVVDADDDDMISVDIDEPLMRNGKEVGRIQCRIEAYWEGETSGFVSNRR